VRETAKALARLLATVLVTPALVSYAVRRSFMGRDASIEGSTQALALLPGLFGDYLRRAFLMRTLDRCASTASIRFGVLFSQAGARIDDHVYVGPGCHLGLVHLERDVLLASGVHIPSGGATHGIEDLDTPIREQPGAKTRVRIGEGSWIGSASVVLADVGRHCVIGAGSVVTKPIPDFSVAAGVPARVIRARTGPGPTGPTGPTGPVGSDGPVTVAAGRYEVRGAR
jgi:acetyltransferase-like isoleucine patch superfamily enzyme